MSTALKWGNNGELAPLDLHQILGRLIAHDEEAAQLMARFQDGLPDA